MDNFFTKEEAEKMIDFIGFQEYLRKLFGDEMTVFFYSNISERDLISSEITWNGTRFRIKVLTGAITFCIPKEVNNLQKIL